MSNNDSFPHDNLYYISGSGTASSQKLKITVWKPVRFITGIIMSRYKIALFIIECNSDAVIMSPIHVESLLNISGQITTSIDSTNNAAIIDLNEAWQPSCVLIFSTSSNFNAEFI